MEDGIELSHALSTLKPTYKFRNPFLNLVGVIHESGVLGQFNAIAVSNFYIFAITDAGLYNKLVLGKQ